VRTFADLPPLLKLLAELRRRRKEQQAVDDKLDAYLQAILVAMSRAPEQAESTKELMRQEGLDPLSSMSCRSCLCSKRVSQTGRLRANWWSHPEQSSCIPSMCIASSA